MQSAGFATTKAANGTPVRPVSLYLIVLVVQPSWKRAASAPSGMLSQRVGDGKQVRASEL